MSRRCRASGARPRPAWMRGLTVIEGPAPWSLGSLLMDPPDGWWRGYQPEPVPRIAGPWAEPLG